MPDASVSSVAPLPAANEIQGSGRLGWRTFLNWLAPRDQLRDPALDFVRGVAILLAMGRHFNKVTGNQVVDLVLAPGRVIGWAGVDLFFVLSGFLVGGLVLTEIRDTGTLRAKRFLTRRALKIWPVLYVYLLLLLVTGRHPWQDYLWQNAFHIQNYFVSSLDHLWSLAVEEHFYTALCVGFVLVERAGWVKRSVMLKLAAVILLGCLAIRSVAFLSGTFTFTQVQWQTQFRIDALTCGVLLAWCRCYRPSQFASLSRPKLLLCLLWVTGAFVLALGEGLAGFRPTVGYSLAYATAACFLLFCIDLPIMARSPWYVRAVTFLGLYSYAMYVYQFVGLRSIESFLRKLSLEFPSGVGGVGIRYLAAIVVAVIMTKLIEHPVLRLRDRLFPRIKRVQHQVG